MKRRTSYLLLAHMLLNHETVSNDENRYFHPDSLVRNIVKGQMLC